MTWSGGCSSEIRRYLARRLKCLWRCCLLTVYRYTQLSSFVALSAYFYTIPQKNRHSVCSFRDPILFNFLPRTLPRISSLHFYFYYFPLVFLFFVNLSSAYLENLSLSLSRSLVPLGFTPDLRRGPFSRNNGTYEFICTFESPRISRQSISRADDSFI
jgi:hypothetical protein